jgi:L-ascorbate metabolism protein UlaG (beta-lactamase superfamily)
MKINYPGHATLLVESEKINFMCDPWLVGDTINSTVWIYPPRRLTIRDLPKLDFIYISHDHWDHCNSATLNELSKDIHFYILDFPNKHDVVYKRLIECGMKNIHILEPRKTTKIDDNTQITIYPADAGWIDSAAIIEHDGFTIMHSNDCELSESTYKQIGNDFHVDMAFLPYAGFSGFPACYEFEESVLKRLALKKKKEAVEKFFSAAEALDVKWAVPAAGDLVVLGENLTWINYLDRCSPDEVLELAKNRGWADRVLSMKAGDSFEVGKGFVPHPKREEWQYTAEDQARYGDIPNIKKQIDRYNSWLQDVECENFQEEVLGYFDRGLKVNAGLAEKVGDYIFSLKTTGKLQAEVTIDFSKMTLDPYFDEGYTKKIVMEGVVLYRVMREDIGWGSAYDSCTMTLDRRPPEFYNVNFWQWLYNLDALNYYKKDV